MLNFAVLLDVLPSPQVAWHATVDASSLSGSWPAKVVAFELVLVAFDDVL